MSATATAKAVSHRLRRYISVAILPRYQRHETFRTHGADAAKTKQLVSDLSDIGQRVHDVRSRPQAGHVRLQRLLPPLGLVEPVSLEPGRRGFGIFLLPALSWRGGRGGSNVTG